ncbi:hypothetical protein FQZ97_1274810 [compost metagenome]
MQGSKGAAALPFANEFAPTTGPKTHPRGVPNLRLYSTTAFSSASTRSGRNSRRNSTQVRIFASRNCRDG